LNRAGCPTGWWPPFYHVMLVEVKRLVPVCASGFFMTGDMVPCCTWYRCSVWAFCMAALRKMSAVSG